MLLMNNLELSSIKALLCSYIYANEQTQALILSSFNKQVKLEQFWAQVAKACEQPHTWAR